MCSSDTSKPVVGAIVTDAVTGVRTMPAAAAAGARLSELDTSRELAIDAGAASIATLTRGNGAIAVEAVVSTSAGRDNTAVGDCARVCTRRCESRDRSEVIAVCSTTRDTRDRCGDVPRCPLGAAVAAAPLPPRVMLIRFLP